MANANSANYITKGVVIKSKRNSKAGTDHVVATKVVRNVNRVKWVYNPNHPMADEKGMVQMPDIDPLTALMDLQQTRLDNDRLMKASQLTTDQRHRILSMINH